MVIYYSILASAESVISSLSFSKRRTIYFSSFASFMVASTALIT